VTRIAAAARAATRVGLVVARTGLRRAGFDVVRFANVNAVQARRTHALAANGIETVFDVGANVGQYGRQLRAGGYTGTIISYEPGETAFRLLERTSRGDPRWHCRRLALGDRDGLAGLNVSRNTATSSLLRTEKRLLEATADAVSTKLETVPIAQLDTVAEEFITPHDELLLKLDVQGSELSVLEGATRLLARVAAIEIEVSVLPLYVGQALLTDVAGFLDENRFDLVALEPGFREPGSGKLLQLEGFFVRRGWVGGPEARMHRRLKAHG
jgi:FkbM family methyltransferase